MLLAVKQSRPTKGWLTTAEEEAGRRLIAMTLKWRIYGHG
jgi:hypothetical protein